MKQIHKTQKLQPYTISTNYPNNSIVLHKKIYSKTLIQHYQTFKSLYQSRKTQRQTTLTFLIQNSFIIGTKQAQKTLLISQSLRSLHYYPELIQIIKQNLLMTTSLFMQQVQYMFQVMILCRFYQKIKKPQLIIHLITTEIKYPQNCPKLNLIQRKFNMQNKKQLRQFNRIKSQIARYQSILKSLILVTSQEEMVDVTQFLYQQYIKLVKQNQGDLELSTVYFQLGNFYFKAREFNDKYDLLSNKQIYNDNSPKKKVLQAKKYFEICKKIRQSYGQSLSLADTYTNLGLIQYYFENRSIAIEYLKDSLQMKRDISSKKGRLDLCLQLQTLGKWYMMMGQFNESYKKLKQCLQLRMKYENMEQKNRQKDIRRIQVLMIFFFRTIKHEMYYELDMIEKKKKMDIIVRLESQIFIKANFKKYKIHQKQELNYLDLNFSEQIFHMLPLDFIEKIRYLQNQLKQLNLINGIKFFRNFDQYKQLKPKIRNKIQQFLNHKLTQFYIFMDISQINMIYLRQK